MRTEFKYVGKTICNHKEIAVKGNEIWEIRLWFIFFLYAVKWRKVET
jgi:hypothetical protein